VKRFPPDRGPLAFIVRNGGLRHAASHSVTRAMAVIAWYGGLGLTRVETWARRPSRPRKSRHLLARSSASRAPLGGDAAPSRASKSHATLSIRRGCGQKALLDQWMRHTRRGGWNPGRTVALGADDVKYSTRVGRPSCGPARPAPRRQASAHRRAAEAEGRRRAVACSTATHRVPWWGFFGRACADRTGGTQPVALMSC
jgi:hypothetical protein